MGVRIQILSLIPYSRSPCINFYIPCFGSNLLRRFNKIIPTDTAIDTAARDPNPAIVPMAADESTTPCAALVATAVPDAVLTVDELLLDNVNDSRSAVTVTVCAGGWEVMKAVAVTVGVDGPVSELQEQTLWLASLAVPMSSVITYRSIVTVVARVGLVEIAEVVDVLEVVKVVKVGVPIGTTCIGVAVALTGVGVRTVGVGVNRVGVNRLNCSTSSFLSSLRSRGGGGPFRRVCAFIVNEPPRDLLMVVCLRAAEGWRNRQGSLGVAAPRKLRILI